MHQDLGPLIGENRNLLLQTSELISQLSEAQYQRQHPDVGSNSLGEHVRHLIEHYEVFLTSGAAVDYDRRERHPEPERSTATAQGRIDDLCERLEGLAHRGIDAHSSMRLCYHPDDGSENVELGLSTSVARELAFVASHTLHHMALIRMLAVKMDVVPSEDFGVARATRVQESGHMPAAQAG